MRIQKLMSSMLDESRHPNFLKEKNVFIIISKIWLIWSVVSLVYLAIGAMTLGCRWNDVMKKIMMRIILPIEYTLSIILVIILAARKYLERE